VEQLAEVFHYTLKRSEKESVRLEEELDFVRSYLEVEQARFGERLQVRFDVPSDIKGMLIPTMMVQTLVENAIKHGVASVRGVGIVEIRAGLKEGRICIEVLDNGPGFSLDEALSEAPGRSGYGLKNLLQRPNSHYGSSAELHVRKDEASQRTVVSVELPASVPVSLDTP
jgi:LytS/YehU family sensor histidine kinase